MEVIALVVGAGVLYKITRDGADSQEPQQPSSFISDLGIMTPQQGDALRQATHAEFDSLSQDNTLHTPRDAYPPEINIQR